MNNSSSSEPLHKEAPSHNPHRHRRAAMTRLAEIVAISLLSGAAGAKLASNDQESVKSDAPPVTTSLNNQESSNTKQIEFMQERLDFLSKIVASQAGVSVEAVNGDLPGPESLPGYGTQVSPEQRLSFESSVLKMGKRIKGETGAWEEVCTANKVSYEGKEYVVTAAHCLTGDMTDMVSPNKGGGEYGALDITDLSAYEYAVLDPNIPSSERQMESLANVITTSVMMSGGPDIALFTIDSNQEFEAVGSIPISDSTPYITPGIDVALRSLPASSGNEPITYTGVYLGRIENAYEVGSLSNTVDVVGLAGVDDKAKDVCMYGASGSGAQTAEVPLFALSTRHQVDAYDDGSFDEVQLREGAYITTLKMGEALGVDITTFDVICGYSTLSLGDMEALLNPTPAIISDQAIMGGK